MANNVTKKENMVIPEVMADMVSAKLPQMLKFAPLAHIDKTLEGVPGDEITVPKFVYIGDAEDVAEGVAIGTTVLKTATTKAKVKKAGKAVELTDEAMISGYGDPLGEAARQIQMAVASKLDADCVTALGTATLTVDKGTEAISYSGVVDAVDAFSEEEDENKVLFVHPAQVTALRKDPEFLDRTKYGGEVMMTGAIGKLAGCEVVKSKRVPKEGDKYTNFIVKKGALAIYLKRAVKVESDRDILAGTTVLAANEHYGVVLADESKAVKVTFKA